MVGQVFWLDVHQYEIRVTTTVFLSYQFMEMDVLGPHADQHRKNNNRTPTNKED
jgi:hypothetical protein